MVFLSFKLPLAPRNGARQLGRLAQLAVNTRDLLHPLAAFGVFHLHDLARRPVEVVGDISYLLKEPL
jgi:hypothetical protein